MVLRRQAPSLLGVASILWLGGFGGQDYRPLLSQAFTVEIPAGQQQCFSVVASAGEEVFGNYEVLTEGSTAPVVVRVTDQDKTVLHEAVGKDEEVFSFTAQKAGDYELCIMNGMMDVQDNVERTVGFSFRTDILIDEDLASEESIRRLIELGNQLSKGLANILDHQSYMRQREELHSDSMESISSRVFIWTIVEAAVLIGVAIWQVLYISKFFEVRRSL